MKLNFTYLAESDVTLDSSLCFEGPASPSANINGRCLSSSDRRRKLTFFILLFPLYSEKASLELGVLLNPDPATPFTLAAEAVPPLLADRHDLEAAAEASRAETLTAWATYGIDASQFASYGPNGVRNRGHSVTVTVDIPIWDRLTSERKVKETKIREQAGKVDGTAGQRRLLADLTEFYHEADTSRQQLVSLEESVTDAREALSQVVTPVAYYLLTRDQGERVHSD